MSDGPGEHRLARNDRVIIEATSYLLGERGWSDLTLSSVARRAGLSLTPVRDRYPDRLALAAAAWEQTIGPAWARSISSVIAAADAASSEGLHAALEPFLKPGRLHRAAGELLMVAAHDDAVRTVVAAQAIDPLAPLLDPSAADGPSRRAVRGYAVILALGLLMESWRSHADAVDLAAPVVDVARALRSPGTPRVLPPDSAPYLDEGPRFDTGDPRWDSLLRATLRQVGSRGYEAATVEAIVADAGCSQGVLFRRYRTKAEAFLDATRRMIGAATQLNLDYQQRIAREYSPGVAEAIMLREFMRPGREIERVIGLEQYRLAWWTPSLRAELEAEQAPAQAAYLHSVAHLPSAQALARLHLEFAMGMGPVLLAQLHAAAWQLPLDVVTVPLIDGSA